MRCLDCGYVLEGLPSRRCPECARAFNPDDPRSYSRKRPKILWRYWLPGLGLSLGVGVVLWAVLVPAVGWGWATSFVLPLCVGALIGFGCRVNGLVLTGLVFVTPLCWVAIMQGMGLAGFFCGVIFFGVAFLPVTIGTLLGVALRRHLDKSSWSQAEHLPALLIAAIPILAAAIEGPAPQMALSLVTTVEPLDAPPADAFAAWQFYEDVCTELQNDPPWLLRLSPSLRPVRVVGQARKVGDVQTCIYKRGRLSKQITKLEPGRRVEFIVVEQVDIEDDSVELLGGSFTFEPIADGRCRVTLETTYRPRLGPRSVWRPAESLTMQTLHRHVLRGIEEDATDSRESR